MAVNLPANFVSAVEKVIKDVRDLKGQSAVTTPRRGLVTLVAGSATVSLPSTTANTHVHLTIQAAGGTVGVPFVFSKTAGTGFTIHSSSGADTSTVAWSAVEPQ